MPTTTKGAGGSNGMVRSTRTPDGLEVHVALLRDDVAHILAELERRYRSLVTMPRRLEERGAALGRRLLHNRTLLLGASAAMALVGTGVAYLARWRARRRSRLTFKLRRALGWR